MSQSDDNADDPQLKSLRAVWLAMPDEDPPTRGLDALMAAARAQAEVFAAPPWWKRALHALARPPVLALATIMILIGGAVLISKRDDVKDAGPAAPSPVQTPPTSRPEPVEAPRPELDKKLDAVTPPPPTTTTPTTPTMPRVEQPAGRFDGAPVSKPAKPVHKAPAPARAEPKVTTGTTTPSAGTPGYAPQDDAAKSRDGRAKLGGEEAQDASGDVVEAAPAQTRGPTPKQVIVDQLLAQCRSAATRGDCEEAKLIARRIAAQSTAYYKEHVASDATIQKCITPPANAAPVAP